jgi:hypothetical protein
LRQKLVAAQVERPDYDGQRFERNGRFAVGLVLLLFSRQVLAV